VSRELDQTALYEYLCWGYVPARSTIFDAVKKLPPGSRETYWGNRTRGGRYFDAGDAEIAIRRERPVEFTRERVLRTVAQQMVSDVPIGCFLSGGVDSSVVASAMVAAAGAGEKVATFSVGFDDARYDESNYARQVAEHLGTKHHEFRVRPDAAADLPKLAAIFGEPFADSSALPTHYLSREVRGHVKVALSGDGGDELFGGYDRYRAMSLAQRFEKLPALARDVAAQAEELFSGTHPKSAGARVKRFLKTLNLPPGARYASIMRLFDPNLLMELTGKPALKSGQVIVDVAYWIDRLVEDGREVVPAALAVDRRTYLPGDLLTKLDRASMLHNLEVRSPFMDHELVEFAAGLRTDQLLKGGPKRMLREAFAADLPGWVFKRKKMGFAVPIGEWFRSSLRGMLRDHLFASDSFGATHFNMDVVRRMVEEHESQQVDHSQRLYALLMLELWWKTMK
jgi:asparagine synthase (glutamine-hydrolysing)